MRYLMIVKGDENFRASGPPPHALMDAIGELGVEAAKAGKMVSMAGCSIRRRARRFGWTTGSSVGRALHGDQGSHRRLHDPWSFRRRRRRSRSAEVHGAAPEALAGVERQCVRGCSRTAITRQPGRGFTARHANG
jgi:hypothetical protein